MGSPRRRHEDRWGLVKEVISIGSLFFLDEHAYARLTDTHIYPTLSPQLHEVLRHNAIRVEQLDRTTLAHVHLGSYTSLAIVAMLHSDLGHHTGTGIISNIGRWVDYPETTNRTSIHLIPSIPDVTPFIGGGYLEPLVHPLDQGEDSTGLILTPNDLQRRYHYLHDDQAELSRLGLGLTLSPWLVATRYSMSADQVHAAWIARRSQPVTHGPPRIIDMGASEGFLSLAALKLMPPGSSVDLVEKLPTKLAEANRLMILNGYREGEHYRLHEVDTRPPDRSRATGAQDRYRCTPAKAILAGYAPVAGAFTTEPRPIAPAASLAVQPDGKKREASFASDPRGLRRLRQLLRPVTLKMLSGVLRKARATCQEQLQQDAGVGDRFAGRGLYWPVRGLLWVGQRIVQAVCERVNAS